MSALLGDVALVRRLGSNAIHAIELSNLPAAFLSEVFGSACVMIEAPAVVACGAILRHRAGGLVVMHADQRASCIVCRRWLAPRVARGWRVFDPRPIERAAQLAAPPDVEPVRDDLLPRSVDRRDRPSGT